MHFCQQYKHTYLLQRLGKSSTFAAENPISPLSITVDIRYIYDRYTLDIR